MASVSLKVFITPFADKGSEEAAKWSCDSANEALKQVNTIWQKANVGFVINDCIMDRPLDMEKGSRNDDKRLLGVLSLRHDTDSLVHIYLVNAIANSHGWRKLIPQQRSRAGQFRPMVWQSPRQWSCLGP